MAHDINVIFQIWDDTSGQTFEVGEDPDGLDLVEFRWVTTERKIAATLIMDRDMADMLCTVLSNWRVDQDPESTTTWFSPDCMGDSLMVTDDDTDGVGLIEIGWVDSVKKEEKLTRFSFNPEMLPAITKVLRLYLNFKYV